MDNTATVDSGLAAMTSAMHIDDAPTVTAAAAPPPAPPAAGIVLLPDNLWSIAYLSIPAILDQATRVNPSRVAEVFSQASVTSVAPPTAPAVAAPRPFRARVPDPEPYDGSVDKLYPFMDALVNKLTVDCHLYLTEEDKVGYAYACLSPRAQDAISVEFAHLRDPSLSASVRSFVDLVRLLKRRFDDPGRREKANRRLTTMKQGNRSFADFLVDWNRTLADSEYAADPPTICVRLLRSALSIELLTHFVGRSVPTNDYDAFIDFCKELDAQLQQIASLRRNIFPRSPTADSARSPPAATPTYTPRPAPAAPSAPRPFAAFAPPAPRPFGASAPPALRTFPATPRLSRSADDRLVSQGGNKMDLDAASEERDPSGRVTPAAREARRILGHCYRCNGKGHLAQTCTDRSQLRAANFLETSVPIAEAAETIFESPKE